MKQATLFSRMVARFRYPGSQPEEIAQDIGIELPNTLSFSELIASLTHLRTMPTRLKKYMPRDKAEEAFKTAIKKERFRHCSLFYYYFQEGWMEFVLQFDDESRLRRIYFQHKDLANDRGVELPLNS